MARWLLIGVAILGAAAQAAEPGAKRVPATRPPAKPAAADRVPRATTGPFHADSLRLFQAISGEHTHQGKTHAAVHNHRLIAELVDSSDPPSRRFAEMAREQERRFDTVQARIAQLQREMTKAATQMRAQIGMRALEAFLDDEVDLSGIASDMEEAAGGAQSAYVALLEAAGELQRSKQIFLDAVRDRGHRSSQAAKLTISAKLVSSGPRLGKVTITNLGEAPLHHCVILARTKMNTGLTGAEANEIAFGAVGLPLVGFSPEFAAESANIVRLRRRLMGFDQQTLVYVRELASKAIVQTDICELPVCLLASNSADVTLWCDEGRIDAQPVANLEAVQKGLRAAANKRTAPRPRRR